MHNTMKTLEWRQLWLSVFRLLILDIFVELELVIITFSET